MSRLREPVVFFIDHCLGTETLAERLRREGAEVRVLTEEGFSADALDVDWLPKVAANGWAVLTKDKRIKKHPLERRAVFSAKAGMFVLVAGGIGGEAIGEAFARALTSMERIWRTRARPFIATVSAQGDVRVIEGGGRAAAIKRD